MKGILWMIIFGNLEYVANCYAMEKFVELYEYNVCIVHYII